MQAGAQRIEACVNQTLGDRCLWAGAFNSVQNGICSSIGPTNHSVVVCVAPAAASRTRRGTSPDPYCRRGLLHSRGRVCCPQSCGTNCTDDGGLPEPNRLYDAAFADATEARPAALQQRANNCSVGAILRGARPCREVGAPCIMPATQGLPATGFAPEAAGSAVSSSALPLGEQVLAVGAENVMDSDPAPEPLTLGGIEFSRELGEPLLIGCSASVLMLCFCCCCFKLLSCCLRRRQDLPPASPAHGAGNVQRGRRRKRKKKKRRHRSQENEEDEAVSTNAKVAASSAVDPFDDDHLFVEVDVPTPIVDVWARYSPRHESTAEHTSASSSSTTAGDNMTALPRAAAPKQLGTEEVANNHDVTQERRLGPSARLRRHVAKPKAEVRGDTESRSKAIGAKTLDVAPIAPAVVSKWKRPQPASLDLDVLGLAATEATAPEPKPALDRVLELIGTLSGSEVLRSAHSRIAGDESEAARAVVKRNAKFDMMEEDLAASLTFERQPSILLPASAKAPAAFAPHLEFL